VKLNEIELYANLMVACFKDDPGIKFQLEGIDDKHNLFKAQCKCQIEVFAGLDCVATYGDCDGLVMGYFTEKSLLKRLNENLQARASYLLEKTSTDELSKIQQNTALVLEIAKPDWYKKFICENEVYKLQAIMVRAALRGTGVFRKLLTPVLEKARQRRAPVVLQTHQYEHVAKYEHFGFELMEKVESDKIDLACYNMLKY
jgi:predicted GNAT family N-acyltransferase